MTARARTLKRGLGLTCVAALCIALLGAEAANAESVPRSETFHGGATHEGWIDPAPSPPLSRAWSHTLGGDTSYPVFDEESVFVVASRAEPWTIVESRLYAIDRSTGAIEWVRQTAVRHGAPAYGNGRVFVAGSGGHVIAYDAETGRTEWAQQMPGTGSNRAELVAANGLLYVMGPQGEDPFRAFDQATGEIVFATLGFHDLGGAPAVTAERAFYSLECTGFRPAVFAVDSLTGHQIWGSDESCSHAGGPTALHDGLVYAAQRQPIPGDPNPVYRASDGVFVREYFSDGLPAFSETTMFTFENNIVRAHDTTTGALLWEHALPWPIVFQPQVFGDHVFVGTGDARLYAFDALTGAPVWDTPVANPPGSDPVWDRFQGMGATEDSVVVTAAGRVVAYTPDGSDVPVGPPEFPGAAAQVATLPDPGQDPPSTGYLLNPAHNGFLNAAEPAPPLRARWSIPVPDPGYPDEVLVADGRVFVLVSEDDIPPDGPPRVVAIDAATGTVDWAVELGNFGYVLGYEAGRLFLSPNMSNRILALDADTGATLWSAAGSNPVVADGRVYFGGVVARDAATGALLPEVGETHAGTGLPAVGGGRVYAADSCRGAAAFALALGPPIWELDRGCGAGGSGSLPVFGDGQLFVRDNSVVSSRHDAGTGELVDVVQTGFYPVIGGRVTILDTAHSVLAVDTRTGELLWEYPERADAPMIIVGRHVHVPLDGGLAVLDLSTGELVWSTTHPITEGDHYGNSLFAGDGLVVARSDRTLTALESLTGSSPPPDTSITDGPPPVSDLATVRVEYSSPDLGVTFECRTDSPAWEPCPDGGMYLRDLAEGSHHFEVRARTGSTVDPTPATLDFVVDTVPPETSIDSGPGPVSPSRSAAFTLSSPDQGVTFECRLDQGSWNECGPSENLSGLSEGEHTFAARSVDALQRHDPTPPERAWRVDTTSPSVSITRAPEARSPTSTAQFEFSANEPVDLYTCAIDFKALEPCGSGMRVGPLNDGIHLFTVGAVDRAGNESEKASALFVVDTTPPETEIASPTPRKTKARRPRLALEASESARFQCSIDAAPYASCPPLHRLDRLRVGRHLVRARAVDAAGNPDASPAEWRVRIVRRRAGS